ncbi:MAG: DUF418 domain-containing protein [Tannerellaceae bacterium]|nr:DUF418 domain-containing protein [Tannerellaceae bacterium]
MKNNLINRHARIDVADILRGFSVMGIILLHSIEHFNFYSYPDTSQQSLFLNFTDKVIWDSLFFTFGGKAYAIFALLFGFSFFIQDDNQKKRGADFRLRFMWRLVLLFIIGNLNAAFFTGEILVMYSLLGFILVGVCRLPDKVVFWLAVLFLLRPLEWGKAIYALMNPEYVLAKSLVGYYFGRAGEVQSGGTFSETLRVNLWEGQLASLTWAWEYGRIFQTVALFIFGMLLGRKEWLIYSKKHARIWLILLAGALIAYFPLIGLKNLLPDFMENRFALASFQMIFQSLANVAFMILLVTGIWFAFYSTRLKNLLSKLTPYGKMSLTNYITQSIVGSMLFYNWGFGLYRYLGITASLGVGILLFILQLSFCNWWLRSHSHGPFEYFWKKATWIGKKA